MNANKGCGLPALQCFFEIACKFGGNAFGLLGFLGIEDGQGAVGHFEETCRIFIGLITSQTPFEIGLKLCVDAEFLQLAQGFFTNFVDGDAGFGRGGLRFGRSGSFLCGRLRRSFSGCF